MLIFFILIINHLEFIHKKFQNSLFVCVFFKYFSFSFPRLSSFINLFIYYWDSNKNVSMYCTNVRYTYIYQIYSYHILRNIYKKRLPVYHIQTTIYYFIIWFYYFVTSSRTSLARDLNIKCLHTRTSAGQCVYIWLNVLLAILFRSVSDDKSIIWTPFFILMLSVKKKKHTAININYL